MRILAVSREPKALAALEEAIRKAEPSAEIDCFSPGAKATGFAERHGCDAAFVHIDKPESDSLATARRLRLTDREMNIVLVAAGPEYAVQALELRASGYLIQPVAPEMIREELDNLRRPVAAVRKRRVRFQCFGNFEVFIDERPLAFHYEKAKELLAYLVDRRAICTNRQIIAALWEAGVSGSYLRMIVKELLDVFRRAGCDDVLIRHRGQIGIDREKVECDFYDWIQNTDSHQSYWGEYMAQYGWAEFTKAWLEQRSQ